MSNIIKEGAQFSSEVSQKKRERRRGKNIDSSEKKTQKIKKKLMQKIEYVITVIRLIGRGKTTRALASC